MVWWSSILPYLLCYVVGDDVLSLVSADDVVVGDDVLSLVSADDVVVPEMLLVC